MDEGKLQALLEEATAHSYDEEDEFWAVFSTLVGRVAYPIPAQVGGEAVTLVGVDGPTSNVDVGVMARVEKGGGEETVPLADVDPVGTDPESAEWLAVYRYWWGQQG